MNIIYKCRENQFKRITTRYCTDTEGNVLSQNTIQHYGFTSSWFYSDILWDGVCDIPTASNAIINEKPKLCVTGFEPYCYDTVMKYPTSQCSLRRGSKFDCQTILNSFYFFAKMFNLTLKKNQKQVL